MAKKLTYVQNHDGNRQWVGPQFNDQNYKDDAFVYLCQHSDGNVTTLNIIVIPKEEWANIVKDVNAAIEGFK